MGNGAQATENEILRAEHDGTTSIPVKKVGNYVWDSGTLSWVRVSGDADGNLGTITGLSIPEHDYISLSYTGDNLTGVVYKTGGSGGTTVATLTLGYSGSNLISVTKT